MEWCFRRPGEKINKHGYFFRFPSDHQDLLFPFAILISAFTQKGVGLLAKAVTSPMHGQIKPSRSGIWIYRGEQPASFLFHVVMSLLTGVILLAPFFTALALFVFPEWLW